MQVELDEYEAINLLWLLKTTENMIIDDGSNALCSGDWFHQIMYKLEEIVKDKDTKPNHPMPQ